MSSFETGTSSSFSSSSLSSSSSSSKRISSSSVSSSVKSLLTLAVSSADMESVRAQAFRCIESTRWCCRSSSICVLRTTISAMAMKCALHERTQLRCAEHTQLRCAGRTQLRCAECTQLHCAERTQLR
ncbi:hypothetical protein BDD12DRAFT_833817 [Trichophaea hybrida]|nr:hypothetical protein BDD12DRAFT_833817 [Trichophaea hybrida]